MQKECGKRSCDGHSRVLKLLTSLVECQWGIYASYFSRLALLAIASQMEFNL